MALEFHYYLPGCFQEPQKDIDLGKYAVDQGFEGIWFGDHFLPWLDNRRYTHHILPWLGAFMNEVPDVTVGTFVTCPSIRYNPPILAQALATLDNMYPGRFEFGVGTGESLNESHFFDGEWPNWKTLADMLVEALNVIELLWDAEEYVDFEGEYFSYKNIRLYTQPKSELQTHWAAWGPRSAYHAGKHTGNLMTTSTPEHIANQLVPQFKQGLDDTDRNLSDAHISTQFSANIGDPDDLVDEIRQKGEHVPHDTELDNPDPREVQAAANDELAEFSDEQIKDTNNITDDPEELIQELKELEAAGVTRVILLSKVGDFRKTIDAFSEQIIPEFR